MIYFDNNSTTRIGENALKTFVRFSNIEYYNPSCIYPAGIKTKYLLDKSRTQIAYILGVEKSNNFIFTSSATESNNTVIYNERNRSDNIYTTQIEHPSILEPLSKLENKNINFFKLNNDGTINIEEYKKSFNNIKPDFVTIQSANNEIGIIEPNIIQIFKLAKEINPNCKVHTDATQILFKSKNKFMIDNIIDYASFSSHKVYGPKGVGLLYVKDTSMFTPLLYGGGQENGFRSSTENISGICSFVESCKTLHNGYEYFVKNVEKLRNLLYERIKDLKHKYSLNLEFNSFINSDYLVNTINFSIPSLNASKFLKYMYNNNICISAKSACHSKGQTQSHVLDSIGKSKEVSENSVRVSLGIYNEEFEINIFIKKFEDYIKNKKF